jgi:hypothetical protein
MIVVRKDGWAYGPTYWACQSIFMMEDASCGFAFPRSLRKRDVAALARGRAQYLAKHGVRVIQP